ncbi:MAG: hypothetical protein JSU09_11750 [Bacteroidetes bacterium]|nr:hypothetical protein [Bacteroidota bacterium]
MTAILYVLLTTLIVFSFWNLVNLRQLIKNKSENVGAVGLSDPKYFELKYKIQFQAAMFAVFVSVGAFYGYNTLEEAKKEARAEIIKSTDSLNSELKRLQDIITQNKSDAKELENSFSDVSRNLPRINSSFNRLNELEEKIQIINSKNILKQNYYIISSIERPVLEKPQKLFLKDLTTSHGDKLPEFKLAPVIIPITDSKFQVSVFEITTESFVIAWGNNLVDIDQGVSIYPSDKSFTFSLLIIER